MSSPVPAEALAAAGVLGAYFAVDPLPAMPPAGWDPYPVLVTDPAALRRRVTTTASLLAAPPGQESLDVEERIAASLTSLGLAARLLSPVLGAALLTGLVPVVRPESWLVGPAGSGPVGMAAHADGGRAWATPVDLAREVGRQCLEPVVLPLLAAFANAFGVPRQVLTGNAASAAAGAVQMIAQRRPELAAPAGDALACLLHEGPLVGAGAWTPAGRRPFTRRSCCLLYRLADGPPPCGDCVLHLSPARRAGAV